MILSFTLSMPNANTNNWTGRDKLYVLVKSFGRNQEAAEQAQSILNAGYYRYNFGDGWCAGITVEQVTPKEARRLRRKSDGFCGYEWMVHSIINNGKIIASTQENSKQ